MNARFNTVRTPPRVSLKMLYLLTYALATIFCFAIQNLDTVSHAIENKIYSDLGHRISFRGSNKACHYQLTYKGSAFTPPNKIFSSHSSFTSRKISGKKLFFRQASFPITLKDLFLLTRSGEAKIQNPSLTRMILTKIAQTKNASDFRSISKNLELIISSTSKINPLVRRQTFKSKVSSGLYWRDPTKKTLFALASLRSSSFALVESCSPLPKKGILKLKR